MSEKFDKESFSKIIGNYKNFVFIGETGSGKSEIAINFARYLKFFWGKEVHLFDMDQTKPLLRTRDVKDKIEAMGVDFHHEIQFYDAPTVVGGVKSCLANENAYVVLDVGGDHTGARMIGAYFRMLNKENTAVFYVVNSYRPWSQKGSNIERTLQSILYVSHIEKVKIISNPNNGSTTTSEEFIRGNEMVLKMLGNYINIEFACVKKSMYETVFERADLLIMPIDLYLTYEWENRKVVRSFPRGVS